VDQSTNGSFVRSDTGEETFVRRDAAALKGHGHISLGEPIEPGSPFVIEYDCEEYNSNRGRYPFLVDRRGKG